MRHMKQVPKNRACTISFVRAIVVRDNSHRYETYNEVVEELLSNLASEALTIADQIRSQSSVSLKMSHSHVSCRLIFLVSSTMSLLRLQEPVEMGCSCEYDTQIPTSSELWPTFMRNCIAHMPHDSS
jgi:hypothetical protein